MASIIGMAVYDTVENDRTKYTKATLDSLKETVNLVEHTLYIVDNASCDSTKKVIEAFCKKVSSVVVITNEENIGTAKAINKAWKFRKPGQHCIKMDNDVVIYEKGWVDLLEDAISRDPEKIGQAALKRKDLAESPNSQHDFYKSEIFMLPHNPGQRWIIGEEVQHCMGTCVMHNSKLIDKVGGLEQMEGIYGFDDSLMSLRSRIAGFKNIFIPSVNIDHIDHGDNPYSEEKKVYAGKMMAAYNKAREEYISGTRNVYYQL